MRNIGSAIGIAATQALLVRNTQIVHAGLVENLSRANGNLFTSPLGAALGLQHLSGVAALNEEVNRQAAMIAYLDDFRLLFVLTCMVIPALVLMQAREAEEARGGRGRGSDRARIAAAAPLVSRLPALTLERPAAAAMRRMASRYSTHGDQAGGHQDQDQLHRAPVGAIDHPVQLRRGAVGESRDPRT